jgi:uncharacterized membrane protein
MTLHFFRLRRDLRSAIWLIPLLGLLAGLGAALLTTAIDRANHDTLVGTAITGTPTDVQQILNTTATALVTMTSLVLSLTLVAVQLAMGQFSPRIVRALLNDRRNQAAIGLFVGTLAYTIVVIREINDQGPNGGTVPGLSVMVAYLLSGLCIAVLILFVHHAGQSIRVAGLIDLVGDETLKQLDRKYGSPAGNTRRSDPEHEIRSDASGNITAIHEPELVAAARRAGAVLEMVPTMGDFVPCGAILFRVKGEVTEALRSAARDAVYLGRERTHEDDPAYGVRKLVDIAERAISSSPFDDPTTTVMAINRLHDCLRLLATREFPSGHFRDEAGDLRLVMRTLDWDGYVRLAFDELRLVGAGSPQVARRLRAAIEDIRSIAPPERHPPLDRQLELLDAGIERQFDDEADLRAARVPDNQGIGSGPDLRELVTGSTDGSARPEPAASASTT